MKNERNWIRRDPSNDLLNSLEHCLLCFTLARSDERNWKWCVTAAHSAAQIAMVIVLDKYDQLDKRSREKLFAFHTKSSTDPNVKWPETRLAKFMVLYDTCVNHKHLPPDVATDEHRSNLDRLNSLRNHWTHFGEDSSSVAIDYARTAVHAGIELVTKLPLPPTNSLYANFTDETRLKVTIDSLLQLLAAAERDDHTESAAACDDSDSAQYAAFADETGKLDDI